MKIFFKILGLAFVVLLTPLVLSVGYSFIKHELTKDCSQIVDTDMATRTIEKFLRRPAMSSVMTGLKPSVIEIAEIGSFSDNQRPDERAYKFRIEGAQPEAWAHARVDPCGLVDISGITTGKNGR